MEFEPSEQFDFQGTQTNLGGISKELEVGTETTSSQHSLNRWKPNVWQ
jgi:hypothetical protein